MSTEMLVKLPVILLENGFTDCRVETWPSVCIAHS